jgi:hypothetical protein
MTIVINKLYLVLFANKRDITLPTLHKFFFIVLQKGLPSIWGQNEPTLTNALVWMDGDWMGLCFSSRVFVPN